MSVTGVKELVATLNVEGRKNVPELVNRFRRRIALQLFSDVTFLSPVKTGRFRGSWTLAAGKPDVSVAPEGGSAGAAAGVPLLGGASLPASMPLETVIWLNNQLVYAEALEEGHSRQAPDGVLDPALAWVADDLGKLGLGGMA